MGPVYIESADVSGKYDREFFRVEGIRARLQPRWGHGNGLSCPGSRVKALEDAGESTMKVSLAKACLKDMRSAIDQRTHARHGEPIRVKQGKRVLFHVLNGSATEIRSLALPEYSFHEVALDGNRVPHQATESEIPSVQVRRLPGTFF